MNHSFSPIGNDKASSLGAASRNARGSKKWLPGSTDLARCALLTSTALVAGSLALAIACASDAYALPTGGAVSAGGATITSTSNTLTVNQSSQNAAINWQSFSIGQGESVLFAQPNSGSVALNRVLGPDGSNILGRLSANGKVFLVNPNGVLFGDGAQVNVGGLVASTLDISDADFMAGQYRFSGAAGGRILNRGVINADGGFVALLGSNISNDGVISARLGSVALAAGTAVTLDVAGNGLLNVAVNAGAVNALVQNGGLIRADGGYVAMTAQAAGDLLKTAVNNTGVIEARTIENRNGTITLLADMQSGTVSETGTLDASGAGAGQSGGRIVVTGHQVGLAGQANIDASGDAGGGTVLVGGDYQGKNPEVPNATAVDMSSGVTIAADARSGGDGGKVVLWSDGVTQAFGTITARGGALSGDGGLIETSGPHLITNGITVNASATHGRAGLWLLDPDYFILGAGGDTTGAAVQVTLNAGTDVTINATGNITLGDTVTWTTNAHLTLNAGVDVLMTGAGATTASTVGSVTKFNAGRDVIISAGTAMTASAANTTIELDAGRDISVSGAMTASGTGAVIKYVAGRNMTIGAALTADGGGSLNLTAGNDLTQGAAGALSSSGVGSSITLKAGHNLTQSAAMTSSGVGDFITLRADNIGTPGPAGGTVILNAPAAVVSAGGTVTIYYSPENGYVAPNNYGGMGIGAPTVTPYMWVFATAHDKVYDGNTNASLAFVGDPTVGGTVAVGLSGSATFANANVGTSKSVNLSGVSLTGAGAGRYVLFTGTTSTASITPAHLTITANNASKTFGQAITFAGGAFTTSGLVAGETVGSVTETSPGAAASATVVAGPYAITPSAATGGTFDANNYSISYVQGTLTVTGAPLTITANNASKVYGQALTFAGGAFTAVGLLGGDTIGSVTETSPGASATATVAGGPYAITPSAAVGGTFNAANYVTTYVPGTLTVTRAPLTITANNASKLYGNTLTFGGSEFTSTGLQNGDTIGSVTETSTGTAASATVAGGPYTIAVSNAVGGTFNLANYTATYVPGTLTVTPATLTVTANNASKVYGNTLTFTGSEFTSVGLKNGETIGRVTETSSGAIATAGVGGNPYAITISNATGGTFNLANYTMTYVPGTLTVTPAPLVITANNVAKVFPDVFTFGTSEFTSVGLKNGDTIGAVILTSAGSPGVANVALLPYAITPSSPTGGTFDPANYTTTFVAGGLTITAPVFSLDSSARNLSEARIFTGLGYTPTALTDDGFYFWDSATVGNVITPTLVKVMRPILQSGELQLAVIDDGVRMPPVAQVAPAPPVQPAPPPEVKQPEPAPAQPVPPKLPPKLPPKPPRS